MKLNDIATNSLRFFWRTNLAVVLGMAVGTAVLIGALIIGDSVRGSLRRMTLERLGGIDHALVANDFFNENLASRLAESPEFQSDFESAAPAILLTGSVENADTSALARGVNVIGVDEQFWNFQNDASSNAKSVFDQIERAVALNARLANEIGNPEGGAVIVRVQQPDPIPAEAVHGRRTGNVVRMRLDVAGTIPDEGLARFGITPSQQLPLNVFVPLQTLQASLDQPGKVNAIFVGAREAAEGADAEPKLQSLLAQSASVGDLGLKLVQNESPTYVSIESERMVLREDEAAAIENAAKQLGLRAEPTLTYLANTIATADREIPYSIVSALDPNAPPPFGPLKLIDGSPTPELGERDILLNSWAAEDLEAQVGDSIRLSYYVSGAFGEFETSEARDFMLRGVVAMEGAGLDPGLTPAYPGIHEADNIRDWDPPFPVDLRRIRDKDEEYWKAFRTTPKGYVSLATGLQLWTSRFGRLTSIRVAPAEGKSVADTAELLAAELRSSISPETAGLMFQPIKAQGLEAAKGATDFGMLFLALSFFVIVAAMLLVRLLFTLAIERRAREVGFLMAAGYTSGRIRNLFLTEGACLAAIGGAIGIPLGIGYAALMLYGLKTWWVGSVGTTFLWLFVEPASVAIGYAIGVIVSLISIFFAVRAMTSTQASRLLSGASHDSSALVPADVLHRQRRRAQFGGNIAGAVAIACIARSAFASASAQAALFMAGGAALMVAALFYLSVALRARPAAAMRPGGFIPVARLGSRNASRHRARSVLTAGLVASATFIIVAVAANRHGAAHAEIEKDSGNGGFALMAESDIPLLHDLNTPEGREEFSLPNNAEELFAEGRVFGLRLNPGADASCLNLYRPSQPRILGAPPDLIERGGFAFQSALAQTEEQKSNPWLLLDSKIEDGAIPAIGDYNTVLWILHSGLGKTLEVEDGSGNLVKLRLVGLLKGSALQSELIIAEKNFLELYPERSGYQFFLIETPPSQTADMRQTLEASLKDFGLDVFPTQERIEAFRAVENTYLSTFQALGGLGLLLGTLGLGAVMLRNILERRGELALLRSLGYRGSALAVLVLAENGFLLLAGLLIGAGAALAAVAPNVIDNAAAVPWLSLAATLLAVFIVGMLSGAAAVVAAVRSPLIESLRAP